MEVVVVQADIDWEDKPANHRRVRRLLMDAGVPSGALVVLAEMFDSGFSMNTAATAQGEARESESFLRELARQFDAAVLGGVVGPLRDGRASNEAVAFSPDGEELTRYRKMQPFTPAGEDAHYGAGDRHTKFTWQGVTIAPFICYDLRFPEVFRPAAAEGAELLCVIANWPAARSEHWVRLLQARAIENQAYTVGVNRCGADPSLTYDGRSCAFDPQGECLAEADSREQVLRLSVDGAVARGWREAFPALRDRRS